MYKWELCFSVNNIALPLPILSSFLLSLSFLWKQGQEIRQRKRKERTYALLRIQGRRKSQVKFVLPKSLNFCWDKNQWQQLTAASQRIQRSATSLGIQIFLNKTFWSEVLRVKGVMTSLWRCLFLTHSFLSSLFLFLPLPILSFSINFIHGKHFIMWK